MNEDMDMMDKNEAAEGDDKVSPKDAAKWKKEILAINDRDLIEYIQELCRSRLDIGRAEHKIKNAHKAPKKNKYGEPVSIDYYQAPKKLPPFKTEPENLDEVE